MGTEITDSDISNGVLQPISGRNNGDVELVVTKGHDTITIHVHAQQSGGPGGGGMKVGKGPVSKGNAPPSLVDKIAKRDDFWSVVNSCTPKQRSDVAKW
jgi:hypothetical protein